MQEHRWWCFGCSRGGDVLDFVQHHGSVSLGVALAHVEAALGFEEGPADELSLLIAGARRTGLDGGPPTRREWERVVAEVSEDYLREVRPYLRCRDEVVAEIAWDRAEMVFSSLDEAARTTPVTERGAREELRRLETWASGWALGMARDVTRATGKDRLDAALQRVCGTANFR